MTREPKTYEEALSEAIQKLEELILVKHYDYGSKNLLRFGELGILVRSSDKIERLLHLIQPGVVNQVSQETMRDTWLDLAGYAIQGLMMYDQTYSLPTQRELENRE